MSVLSRKRRILNLALNISDTKGACEKITDSVENNTYTDILEERSQNESPVPLVAQNIDVVMADVWKDVFQNDKVDELQDSVHNKDARPPSPPTPPPNQSLIPLSSTTPLPPSPTSLFHDTIISEELTPIIGPEVPSSFENSPAISLDEFENNADSTPSSSQYLNLSTPIPSPINTHKKCEDEFCPEHISWIDSVTSVEPTTHSDSSLNYVDISRKKRKTKKRLLRKEEWSDAKRKYLTNLGKCYISKKGKLVDGKVLGKPCNCRDKCRIKITEQQRLACLTKFWNLGSKEKQWSFVIKYVHKSDKNRCLNRSVPNKRKYTFKYFLPIISSPSYEVETTTVNVCKTMFLNTIASSERIIKTAFEKYDGSCDVEKDLRGRHNNHRIIINNEMVRSVCDHVNSFAPVESHFIRKDSTKLYLDGSLSISQMYRLYKEWFDSNVYSSKIQTERQYRDVVNDNFNLSFHIPKKDQCNVCHIHRNNSNPSDSEKTCYKEHLSAKEIARNLKRKDKQDAVDSKGTIVASVFDFEKVLNCPHGEVNIFYYKRKLSCFNFTIFDMGKRQAFCYMWNETVAKRGANEVSSCLLHFIEKHVNEGVKEFRFWSDNCAGQNRNRFVYALYMYAAKKFTISITHRFLEKGHTQNEGDSVHALIERSCRSKIIYTPHEWHLLARWAKTSGEPYMVKNMKQQEFFDFKTLVNDKLWNKNTNNQKIMWNKIKEVRVDVLKPNILYYKYDLDSQRHNCLVIGNGSTRNNSLSVPVLKHAYSSPLGLSKAKYNDLLSLCNSGVIPGEYADYFRALPHCSENLIESSDEEV